MAEKKIINLDIFVVNSGNDQNNIIICRIVQMKNKLYIKFSY